MRLGDEKGQTAIEYAGLLAVVATIFVALAALDLPQKMVGLVSAAICELGGGTDCSASGKRDRRLSSVTRADRDGDGLSNRRERRLGTSSTQADSDGDGINDGDEVRRGLDPRSRDSDRDGIQDAREAQLERTKHTDPTKADSDGDGLLDGAELAAGTPANFPDADKDTRGGDPNAAGRGDGLTDFEEVFRYGTDPRRSDTDEDGQTDGEEVRAGTNPLVDERSLGDKLGPEVAGILLDDPFGLGKGGALNKLGKGLDDLAKKLGIKAGKEAKEAVTDAADNVVAAQRRRRAAEGATPATPKTPRNWLRGTDGNAGPVPPSVAAKLRGREYSSPDHFRETFWRAAAEDPALTSQFSASNVTRMRQGLAPIAPRTQHYGKHRSYVLHHRTPVARGGDRYDPDNIMVVSPRVHQEVLDGSYHFGNGG